MIMLRNIILSTISIILSTISIIIIIILIITIIIIIFTEDVEFGLLLNTALGVWPGLLVACA